MFTRQPKILHAVRVLLLSGLFFILLGYNIGNTSVFPSRPVEVIIPWGPGGNMDLAVRIMSEELSKALGVPVILNNKGGGGGAVGTEYAARAKPDGYTILMVPVAFVILPVLTPEVNYKLSDFTPLCKYAYTPSLVVVRKASPFKSFKDLISYAKKNPGKLTWADNGFGTGSHFNMEIIKIEAGIDVSSVHYMGGGEVNTSVLGGHVDVAFNGYSASLGLLKSGDFRALAFFSSERIPSFPDVPTLVELGYPKACRPSWTGYVLPKGTPKPIMDKLASAFEKAIKNPVVKKNMGSAVQTVDYQNSAAFLKFINEEYKMYEDVAKKAKLIK